MNKYYSYFFKKRNKKLQKINFIAKIFTATIIFIIIFVIYYKVKNSVSKIFSVRQVYILQNDTTIPNDVIYNVVYKQIESKKINVFNYKNLVFQLKVLFPEIKEVKVISNFPINKLKIIISAFSPIGYKKESNNELTFLSYEKGLYKVYDATKIKIDKLCEIEGNIESSFLKLIYQKFNEISVWGKIKKICMENNKCILYININDNCIVTFFVDKKIQDVKKEQLSKLVKYNFANSKKVYTQLLSQGKVYIE